MKSARILVNLSYIGTGFSGTVRPSFNSPLESIQSNLEEAIVCADRSLSSVKTYFSSRTDAGVHAIHSTAHFDVPIENAKRYNLEMFTYCVNKYFNHNAKTIQVTSLQRVNSDFNARFNAKSRTYLYRLATLKPEYFGKLNVRYMPIPIIEYQRLHIPHCEFFDIDKVKSAIKLFEGTHDFGTFTKTESHAKKIKSNIRTMYNADIIKGQPLKTLFTNNANDYFDFWDIHFKASGYTYNQIRRMVGTLVCVAKGRVTENDILTMLRIPSKHSWISTIQNVPPFGLYLAKVEYDEKDLIFTESD